VTSPLATTPAPPAEQLDPFDAAALLSELAQELEDLRPGFSVVSDYYDGWHPLAVRPNRMTKTYRDLVAMATSNWCRLVVDVVAERLVVGSIRSSRSPDQDAGAWAMWQANNLDATSDQIHTEALKLGCCYGMAWPTPDGGARISGEHPFQMHARYAGIGDAYPEAAVKLWMVGDRDLFGTLYTPTTLYRFRTTVIEQSATFSPRVRMPTVAGARWEPRADDDDGGWLVPNPLGVVPIVRFATMPDLLGGYTSEITPILSIQNRINKTTFDRLISQEFCAFPQRWVTGIDVPTDPETGKPVEPFNTAVDRMLVATSPDTAFGQFPASTGDAYLRAIEADVQALATQSRTPPHYLTGGMGQFPSGESVRATEYGLSQKVHNRQTTFGEAWESLVRLAALAANDTALAQDTALGVVWADVEARSESEVVDGLLKMAALGVPHRVLWERWGATPTEADRWEAAEAEATAAAAQIAPPANPNEATGANPNPTGNPEATR
jgi:hypothetical protein